MRAKSQSPVLGSAPGMTLPFGALLKIAEGFSRSPSSGCAHQESDIVHFVKDLARGIWSGSDLTRAHDLER
jgi:hypothetical protein